MSTPSLKQLAAEAEAQCKPLRRVGRVRAREGMVLRNRQVTPNVTVRISRIAIDKSHAVLEGDFKGSGLVLLSGGYVPPGWFEVRYDEKR